MFYIRTDGNSQIGAGHIMRCISIAEALKDMGKVTIFIVSDEESAKLVRARGFGYLVLYSRWNNLEEEIAELKKIIRENNIQSMLIDSYQVTPRYMAELSDCTKIVYMDDLGEAIYPADTLINYNLYGKELPYQEKYQEAHLPIPKLLLGCEYAPLRREFWSVEYSVNKKVKNVFLSTGGSDSLNLAGKILGYLQKEVNEIGKEIQFHVVSGAFNPNLDFLKELEKTNSGIHIYTNVNRMAELMQKCDVAISAYGSTIYELCALGIPTIGFSFADNQKKAAEAFGKEITKNAGDFLKNEEAVLSNIATALREYINSYEERVQANKKMEGLLDGSGAIRIAEALKKL